MNVVLSLIFKIVVDKYVLKIKNTSFMNFWKINLDMYLKINKKLL